MLFVEDHPRSVEEMLAITRRRARSIQLRRHVLAGGALAGAVVLLGAAVFSLTGSPVRTRLRTTRGPVPTAGVDVPAPPVTVGALRSTVGGPLTDLAGPVPPVRPVRPSAPAPAEARTVVNARTSRSVHPLISDPSPDAPDPALDLTSTDMGYDGSAVTVTFQVVDLSKIPTTSAPGKDALQATYDLSFTYEGASLDAQVDRRYPTLGNTAKDSFWFGNGYGYTTVTGTVDVTANRVTVTVPKATFNSYLSATAPRVHNNGLCAHLVASTTKTESVGVNDTGAALPSSAEDNDPGGSYELGA